MKSAAVALVVLVGCVVATNATLEEDVRTVVQQADEVFHEETHKFLTPIIQNLLIKGHQHYGQSFVKQMDKMLELNKPMDVSRSVPMSSDSLVQCVQYRTLTYDVLVRAKAGFLRMWESDESHALMVEEISRNRYVDDVFGAYALCDFVLGLKIKN